MIGEELIPLKCSGRDGEETFYYWCDEKDWGDGKVVYAVCEYRQPTLEQLKTRDIFQLTLVALGGDRLRISFIGTMRKPQHYAAKGIPESLLSVAATKHDRQIVSTCVEHPEGEKFVTEDAKKMWNRFVKKEWARFASTEKRYIWDGMKSPNRS